MHNESVNVYMYGLVTPGMGRMTGRRGSIECYCCSKGWRWAENSVW